MNTRASTGPATTFQSYRRTRAVADASGIDVFNEPGEVSQVTLSEGALVGHHWTPKLQVLNGFYKSRSAF